MDQIDPFLPFKTAYERVGSARERTLAKDVSCARGPAVRLRIIRLQFAYLLGLRPRPRPSPSRASRSRRPVSRLPARHCDLRHSADLKNVPHPVNAPNLTKKRRLEESA
jgi:hypothetical protein